MTVICRTCLKEINDDSVTFYLDSTDTKSTTITVRCKLERCVPEMDLDVVPNAVICNSCFDRLTLAHEFKNKCLETEGRIQSYIEQMGYILTCIDLKDIVEQSKIKPSPFQTPFFCSSDCTSFMQQPTYTIGGENLIKDSSQEITTPTMYDTNRNPIIGSLLEVSMKKEQQPKEKSLDIKNLQCDTQNFFAVPKIAQLLASNENTYKCGQCNYTTCNDLELKSHEKNHSNQKLHKCSECDYSASKRQTLIIHMRKHTGQKLYNCNDCGYSTPYRNTFVQHLKTHGGERPYKCALCDFSSAYSNVLSKHIRAHTDDKPYKCSLCNYRGRLKFDLKTHMRVHTGEKPYKCLLCDYSSSHKTNLSYHMKIHAGEKPYKCKMCDYRSSHKANLRNHIRTHTTSDEAHLTTHTGEKSYLCSFCDYSTSTNINLVKHIMSHTEEQAFHCFDCGYKTATKTDLERHTSTHNVDKPYVCVTCQKTFGNVENLQRHMKHHKKDSSETEHADTDVSVNTDTMETVSDSANVHESTDCKRTPDIGNYESAVKTK